MSKALNQPRHNSPCLPLGGGLKLANQPISGWGAVKRDNVHLARSLRRRATDQERMLWSRLRGLKALGFHFRRQHPIGPFVVDFVCLSAKLVVEVDGAQHFAGPTAKTDQERDKSLRALGYEVFRVTNAAVNTAADEVLESIAEALKRVARRAYEAGIRSVEERFAAQAAEFSKRISFSGLPQGGSEK